MQRQLSSTQRPSTPENNSTQHSAEQPATSLIPSAIPTSVYQLSSLTKVRDYQSVSSLRFFSNQSSAAPVTTLTQNIVRDTLQTLIKLAKNKLTSSHTLFEDSLQRVQSKTKAGLSFYYPLIDLLKTNDKMIQVRQETGLIIMNEIVKLKAEQKTKKANYGCAKLAKLQIKQASLERETINRQAMQTLLAKLTLPNSLNKFLAEVDTLSISDKKMLVRLTNVSEQLKTRPHLEKPPFEVMFAYNIKRQDFIVGIRSAYDHTHPHPTLLGGIEPVTPVAGTLHLVLSGDRVNITKIRTDSGHYQPSADSLELVMRYITQQLNARYADQVTLHTFDGDEKTPEITIDLSRNKIRI
tara:strand:- start:3744 stop:4802 length:1059 start_codon:yes stop_codon:yes gene_type:complete